jgi:hypothetical protein
MITAPEPLQPAVINSTNVRSQLVSHNVKQMAVPAKGTSYEDTAKSLATDTRHRRCTPVAQVRISGSRHRG